MQRARACSIIGFWAAALVAAAYWMFMGFRLENLLGQAFFSLVPAHMIEGLVLAPTTLLSLVFVTFLLPPLAFAALLRLLRVRTNERMWAIPATGYLLVLAFMGSMGQILDGDPLPYVPISIWLDGWLALGVALGGLAFGSLLGWWILRRGPEPVVVRAEVAGLTSAST